MRLAGLLLTAAALVGAPAVWAQDYPEAARKQLEDIFTKEFFKDQVRIDPAKTKFNGKTQRLGWTVEVLSDTAEVAVARAIRKGPWKKLIFKDDGGVELGSISLDDRNKVGFLRRAFKKGETANFIVGLPEGVDVKKIKEIVTSK